MLTQAAGRTELIDGSLPLVDSRMATAPFLLPHGNCPFLAAYVFSTGATARVIFELAAKPFKRARPAEN